MLSIGKSYALKREISITLFVKAPEGFVENNIILFTLTYMGIEYYMVYKLSVKKLQTIDFSFYVSNNQDYHKELYCA